MISNEDVDDVIPENDNMDRKYFKDDKEREHIDHSRTIIEKLETMHIAQVREESFKMIAIKNRHSKDDPVELKIEGNLGTIAIVHYDIWHRAIINSTNSSHYMMK